MVLRGYRQWDEARKSREASVERLDIERLRRQGEFPSGPKTKDRLDLVLDFLRETPWAKHRVWRRKKRVPQGSYVTLKRRGTGDSCVDVLAFVLGLSFVGLETTPGGKLRLQFKAAPEDNCPSPIVVELDTAVSPFGAHRYRADANAGLTGIEDEAAVEFVAEQVGKSVLAAWEEPTRRGYQLHLLWSDGRTSVISRADDTIWINVVDDLCLVVDEAPFASAIAVLGS